MSDLPLQVIATQNAILLIRELQLQYGEILFHQSGGCCDGSVPYCYAKGDFQIGSNDVLLGYVENAPFYIHKAQFVYWNHTQLILDAKEGSGSEFSLEYGCGKSFFLDSRIFTEDEYRSLKNAQKI
ncbi:DUF779 domain-containing protein [Helicobacter aurati]|uniref:DUF779 domain-containing protein n=1 Tax=Helicobacter aurati TaxID=137778 RepID=A0A3D8J209_9HELI|nr:DUF779 domain-containing protein [Helicobacter aurati]RDU71572.1 DUF779 domain-containing protein [Helicobacter aurati]